MTRGSVNCIRACRGIFYSGFMCNRWLGSVIEEITVRAEGFFEGSGYAGTVVAVSRTVL